MEFSRQESWSGLSSLPPGDLCNPGIEPASPALAGEFSTASVTGEAQGSNQSPKKGEEKDNTDKSVPFGHKSKIFSEIPLCLIG